MRTINVKITFTEDILGTQPADLDIYRKFIASKAPDASTIEDEVAAIGVDAVAEKNMTIFPRMEDGRPFLYDYQIKGFFKDTAQALQRLKDNDQDGLARVTCSPEMKAYRKIIDGLIFPNPRQIPFDFDGDIALCQRPLRASTPLGERVALNISEAIPAGATITFSVTCLNDQHIDAVREWLDYGIYRGIGQWRNSGKGRFTWEELSD